MIVKPSRTLRHRSIPRRGGTLRVLAAFSLGLGLTACQTRFIDLSPAPEPSRSHVVAQRDLEIERWAVLTREGREAMESGRPSEAESSFIEALAVLDDPAEHDARVQTTMRNLVRLASIYQRVDRERDAARVMSYVDDYAMLEGRDWLRAANFTAHFDSLTAQSLEHAYRPASLRTSERRDFEPTVEALIRRTARRYQVDPDLVKAVVAAESNFDALAVSEKGAQGLMQLMPETARAMGVRAPFKPSENIRGGVRYLRGLLDRYPDLDHAIAAYNAGPVAVDRYGGIPPYPETQAYVERVLRFYSEYRAEDGR